MNPIRKIRKLFSRPPEPRPESEMERWRRQRAFKKMKDEGHALLAAQVGDLATIANDGNSIAVGWELCAMLTATSGVSYPVRVGGSMSATYASAPILARPQFGLFQIRRSLALAPLAAIVQTGATDALH